MAFPSVLLLKLILTPSLIATVTLASRRFGHGVGGWLTGLPLTSGPVSLFLALEQGPAFAQAAAPGMLAGLVGFEAFCLAYSLAARWWPWWGCLAAGFPAFALAASLASRASVSLVLAFAAALAAVLLAALTMPRPTSKPQAPPPPWWDLPLRMAVATTLVVLLTLVAPRLGPVATGLLSPFPVFAAVLVAFTHRHSGGSAAQSFLRATVVGSISFTAFFFTVGATLVAWGLAVYLLAAAFAVAVNVGNLAVGAGR